MKVHVLGTGLIGTSVGLALGDRAEVVLSDVSLPHLDRAVARGAGRRWDGSERADVVLVCTPPSVTADLVERAVRAGLGDTVSHVASAQTRVQADVEARLGELTGSVCGGHPLAGRERSGPDAATARLFLDRPWVVCPGPGTAVAAAEAVGSLAEACGAVPVLATAEEHDAGVALVSHLPQLAASAVAALVGEHVGQGLDPTRLAGPGVQDTTRIAASDPELWVDVLTRNAAHVAPLVRALADELADAAQALQVLADDAAATQGGAPAQVLRSLLARGRAGRARLPLKQGSPRELAEVVVAVTDRPGQLAAVLAAAARAQVNVEDVRVEHLPGRPRGLLELLVPAGDAGRARQALAAAGWDVLDAG
jgi:prephenate dehydrogenase